MVGTHSQARDLSRWDTWVTVAEDHDDSAARGKIRAERRIVSGCCILDATQIIIFIGERIEVLPMAATAIAKALPYYYLSSCKSQLIPPP